MPIAGFTNKGIIFINRVINYFNSNSDNRLIIRTFNNKTRMIEPEVSRVRI